MLYQSPQMSDALLEHVDYRKKWLPASFVTASGTVTQLTCQMCHELPLTEILPSPCTLRAPGQQPLTSQEGRTHSSGGGWFSPGTEISSHCCLSLCSHRESCKVWSSKKFNASQKGIFKESKSIIFEVPESKAPQKCWYQDCVYRGLQSLSWCCDLLLGRLWHTWTPHKQKSLAMHNNRSLKLPILALFMSKYRLCQHAGTWNTAMLVTGYLHHLSSGDNTSSAHPPLCYLTHFCWLNIPQWHCQWTHPHNKLLVYCC